MNQVSFQTSQSSNFWLETWFKTGLKLSLPEYKDLKLADIYDTGLIVLLVGAIVKVQKLWILD